MTVETDERENLLRARAEVLEVLRRYGLIAHIVMAGRFGKSEALLHVEAPWSKLFLQDGPAGQMLRIRSHRAEYGGDVQAQRRDLEHTLGALSSLATLTGQSAMSLLGVSSHFDEKTGAEHTPIRPEHKQ